MNLNSINKEGMTNAMLEAKLKKEDSVELPMDELFFEKLHDKIMASVEKTEVKPLSRWAKTWVFLERKTKPQRALAKKAVKVSFVGLALTFAMSLLGLSAKLYSEAYQKQKAGNQALILQEAGQNPTEWSELVVSYQNESDFYADVLSQKNDLGTIVEIDQVITQSL